MSTREYLLQLVKKGKTIRTSEISRTLGVSRQTAADHVRRMVDEGLLEKFGSTHSAVYRPIGKRKLSPALRSKDLVWVRKISGMEEDRVFSAIDRKLGLKEKLSPNTYSILFYAFTEMLNNAIDHSQSKQVRIQFSTQKGALGCNVREWGIGIFRNVQQRFKLRNELEAMEHVFKGKQTTAPARHSGEGIFFTSRISDKFTLRSHKIVTTIDNTLKDTFVRDERFYKGTDVHFSIQSGTKKTLEKLFKQYTNDKLEFDRNVVHVKLSQFEEHLSRSQAKRLVLGLEKFKRITFDFKGVKQIGQAFADEIFRIFARQHPEIKLECMNALPAVDFMIRRARTHSR